MGLYQTIVADPPWTGDWFVHGQRARRSFQGPAYALMTLEEIEALPVASISHPDANLFLWIPAKLNREGIGVRVARAWGFECSSEFVWEKPNLGMGRFPRMSHEMLLVCSRGAWTLPSESNVRSVQFWRQSYGPNNGGKRHSSKPEGALDLIEQHSPGPYVELFARRHRLGWDVWGDQSANTVALGVMV
jgi:N6-adenosine-specific RNA methylase IME4